MLEEAGIAYFFTHSGPQTALVLSDEPTTGDARPSLAYVDNPNQAAEREFVTKVKLAQQVKPGRFTVRDFDFRNQLDAQLFAQVRAATETAYEQYLYEPGAFWYELGSPGAAGDTPVADDRASRAPTRARATNSPSATSTASGGRARAYETNVVDLAPGTRLAIEPHPRKDISGKKLLVVESSIEARPASRGR